MGDYIKTFIRVRPAIATDSGPNCLLIKNDKTVQLKNDNEAPKSVDRVFSDMDDNGTVWDVVGGPAMEYLGNGKQVVICVQGKIGSGKTHTVRGGDNCENISDSIVGRIIQALAGNEETNLTVLYFHKDIPQDLITGADNLKIKYDDTGASCEGSTTVRIPKAEAGYEHIKKCIQKRNELMAKSPCSETTTFLVYIFGQGVGRLTVIE